MSYLVTTKTNLQKNIESFLGPVPIFEYFIATL